MVELHVYRRYLQVSCVNPILFPVRGGGAMHISVSGFIRVWGAGPEIIVPKYADDYHGRG